MQHVAIRKEEKNGKEYFLISAICLKNTEKGTVQKIPHPSGSDILIFDSLEEAKNAIARSGFSFMYCDEEKTTTNIQINSQGFEEMIFDTFRKKIDSNNPNVAASALIAIAEFPRKETFDILFSKIKEDSEIVRKNAIAGICRYGNILEDRIISSLKSQNWIEQDSALTCISNIVKTNKCGLEKFIFPLIDACNNSNTIVQAHAITTLAGVYQALQDKNNYV